MNILLLGNDPIFTGDLKWGLEQFNHNVLTTMPESVQKFNSILKDFSPQLIITFGSPSYYQNKDILSCLANCNVKYVHWDTDGITWKNIELDLINTSKPNIVFSICPDMLEVLKQQGIRCENLPYAFNPTVHYPFKDKNSINNIISFVGCAYPEVVFNNKKHLRTKSIETLIKPLLDNGYTVDFWGDNRHKLVMEQCFGCNVKESSIHGRCAYNDTKKLYSNSFINIVPQNHLNHLTKRTFEIMGCGGFILTLDTPEVNKHFTDRTDLVSSSNPEQTLKLVKYYINNKKEYNIIRENTLKKSGLSIRSY